MPGRDHAITATASNSSGTASSAPVAFTLDVADFSWATGGVFADLGSGFDYRATTAGMGWTNVVAAEAGGYVADTLNGLSSALGTAFDDRLYAGDTSMRLNGGSGGNDILYGGAGNDTLIVADGNNQLNGGAGNDAFVAGDGSNFIIAGPGDDSFTLGNGANEVHAGTGRSVFKVGGGSNFLSTSGVANTIDYSGLKGGVFVDLGAGYSYKATTAGLGYADASLVGSSYAQDHLYGFSSVVGTAFDDRLYGNDSGDVLNGGSGGNDILYGGAGSDAFIAANGQNLMIGGGGDDSFTAGNGGNFIIAGDGANTFTLGDGDNVITAGNGANSFTLGNGRNQVTAGSGQNTFKLGAGADAIVTAGSTNAVDYSGLAAGVYADLGGSYAFKATTAGQGYASPAAVGSNYAQDHLYGFSRITGTAFDDRLYANDSGDVLNGGSGGNDILYGGAGSDKFIVANGQNLMIGGGGDDSFTAGNGDNIIMAGNGANAFTLGDGANSITAGNGHNSFVLGNGDNEVTAGSGQNTFKVGGGSDFITTTGASNAIDYSGLTAGVFVNLGGSYAFKATTAGQGYASPAAVGSNYRLDHLYGFSSVTGSAFDDRLYDGAGGHDSLSGGAGNDILYGASGNDALDGGQGNDMLITGAAGGDTMTGGAGADTFVFSAAAATALNTITDFLSGTDSIALSNGVFGYATGQSVTLHSGTGSNAASIFGNTGSGFAYSTDTGGLWFDADWSNAGNAVQLATLNGAPTLQASDFRVLG